MGQRLEHLVAQLVDAAGELAGKLLVGGAQGQFRARMDQVGHGLGLGEVDAPVEKGAAGEFARLGQPRAARQHRIQHQLRRQNAAVAGDFDHVLAGEGARRAHDRQQDLVHALPVAHDVAEMDGVRCRRGWLQEAVPAGAKQRSATASACGPDKRMTASPPSPSGVAIAAMVSSSIAKKLRGRSCLWQAAAPLKATSALRALKSSPRAQ